MVRVEAHVQTDEVSPFDARTKRWTGTGEQIVAVVIPSYRVRAHILPLLARIGPEVAQIFVVDDACPEDWAPMCWRDAETAGWWCWCMSRIRAWAAPS